MDIKANLTVIRPMQSTTFQVCLFVYFFISYSGAPTDYGFTVLQKSMA